MEDGTASTLHPPYEDVRLDNRGILDVDPQKITAAAKVPALSSFFFFFLSRLDSITTKPLTHSTMQLLSSFFIWLKKKVARTTYLAPQLLSTTVEVMAPDNS